MVEIIAAILVALIGAALGWYKFWYQHKARRIAMRAMKALLDEAREKYPNKQRSFDRLSQAAPGFTEVEIKQMLLELGATSNSDETFWTLG